MNLKQQYHLTTTKNTIELINQNYIQCKFIQSNNSTLIELLSVGRVCTSLTKFL